jgi:hypothetical protein
MRYDVPLTDGMALEISSGISETTPFPTARLAKGWLLINHGNDLSEEAVGFGVPIVKRGLQAVFPGEIELFLGGGASQTRFTARYTLNLVEKIAHSASMVNNRLVINTKNALAGMIRQYPGLRRRLTDLSGQMRARFGWQTTYGPTSFSSQVTLNYVIDPDYGKLTVEMVDIGYSPDQISEIVIMSEQGAHYFDSYRAGNGNKQRGEEIGCWDEVTTERAEFISPSQKLSFSLHQVKGAKLYRGRELIDDRLAWSGFGYSFSPKIDYFKYDIMIRRLT